MKESNVLRVQKPDIEWYLKFYQIKLKQEHVIPLVNETVVAVIQAQQEDTRAQQAPQEKAHLRSREQASSASKDTMIAALQKRVREQASEIEQLKRQVEVAYGLLATQNAERT